MMRTLEIPDGWADSTHGREPMAAATVRYIVTDLDAALAFYTTHLDFKLEMHPAPTFAMLSRGDFGCGSACRADSAAAVNRCPTGGDPNLAGGIASSCR
jgi:catechol 2,3-dioxygenase-like lactoylglutathione lyase family enzyme